MFNFFSSSRQCTIPMQSPSSTVEGDGVPSNNAVAGAPSAGGSDGKSVTLEVSPSSSDGIYTWQFMFECF